MTILRVPPPYLDKKLLTSRLLLCNLCFFKNGIKKPSALCCQILRGFFHNHKLFGWRSGHERVVVYSLFFMMMMVTHLCLGSESDHVLVRKTRAWDFWKMTAAASSSATPSWWVDVATWKRTYYYYSNGRSISSQSVFLISPKKKSSQALLFSKPRTSHYSSAAN